MDEQPQGMENFKEESQPTPYTTDLADFINENASENSRLRVNVFRSYRRGGKERTSFLCSYDSVPTYEDVREELGPGRYRVNVAYTKKDGTRAGVGRIWEIERDPRLPDPTPPSLQQPAQALGVHEMMEFMKGMLEVVAKTSGDNRRSNSDDISEMVQVMTSTISQMGQEQMKFVTAANKAQLGIPDKEPEQTTRLDALINWLGWAWDSFGASITKNATAAKAAAPIAAAQPQVQYLLSHPEDYQVVLREFCTQRGLDEATAIELLNALEIPSPGQLLQGRTLPADQPAADQPPAQP